MKMYYRILELYSGIGGMHSAWKESGLNGKVMAAVDINTVANQVYTYNFPETYLLTRNIQTLTCKEIEKLNVNTILMSPPCQPFTRNGKYLDNNDTRTNSFIYIINLLSDLECIKYILLENVKGFECSTVHKLFIQKLKECSFDYQECLLCPSSVGIPNSRLRYYCIARRDNVEWGFNKTNEMMKKFPSNYGQPYKLEKIIDTEVPDTYLLNDNLLKRANVLDICHKDSRRSCCFTKAYSHYVHGTGSLFTNCSPEHVIECYERANTYEVGSEEYVKIVKELKLRLFTPNEVLHLMAFPESFCFPGNISRKQCYRLLGNSVNVKVITELLKVLCA